jgi:hypothetical protein
VRGLWGQIFLVDLVERKREREMEKFPIVEEFKRAVRGVFYGMAIPCEKTTADGGTIMSEKVLKFNRKALRRVGMKPKTKVDPRYKGGEDLMRYPVGKPGSPERLEALAAQYASLADDEMSPFKGD